ncbi:MAG: 30S ribosomal protein S7, partial [Dehalococcoidia bacterium]
MSRRRPAVRRIIPPDSRYASVELARFINRVMQRGKKTTAQRVVYAALDLVRDESHREPMEVFELALKNATPL